jgi:1,4-dihydroxy-2-naphthoate octaprenyltransferase
MPVLPTVATAVFVLLQVPPLTLLLSVVVDPAVTVLVPVVAATDAGKTFMVKKVRNVPQPVLVYDILLVPADIPVTTPVDELTVAMAVAEEDQA